MIVPPLVVSLAEAMQPFGQDVSERLLSDPRMEGVWRTLKKMKVDAAAIERLPSNLHLSNWIEPSIETRDASLNDEACAAFFAAVTIELRLRNPPVARADVLEAISQWSSAAKQCRIALTNPMLRPRVDEELRTALSIVEGFFDETARSIEARAEISPAILARKSKTDSATRAHVRAIAVAARDIFGQFLYGTVATVVSVGLQAKPEIAMESVRDWCADL